MLINLNRTFLNWLDKNEDCLDRKNLFTYTFPTKIIDW